MPKWTLVPAVLVFVAVGICVPQTLTGQSASANRPAYSPPPARCC